MEQLSIIYLNLVSTETAKLAVIHDISPVRSSWISLGRTPAERQEVSISFVYLPSS